MKIYLAIPYSGNEEESFKVANKIASQLMIDGNIVFSPISMNHCIAKENDLPTSWEFWKPFDESFIEWCDAVYVVVMKNDGLLKIKQSIGVECEIMTAKEMGKRVHYIHEL